MYAYSSIVLLIFQTNFRKYALKKRVIIKIDDTYLFFYGMVFILKIKGAKTEEFKRNDSAANQLQISLMTGVVKLHQIHHKLIKVFRV